jgi:hypothetical protein
MICLLLPAHHDTGSRRSIASLLPEIKRQFETVGTSSRSHIAANRAVDANFNGYVSKFHKFFG